ncbi:MAG: DUF1566 domain-containing protein [Candidatus Binatia bacterium]|jgi:hypothetical protein
MKRRTITIAARQITGGLVLAALLLRPVPVRATCVGDCDSQGQVTVDEILTLVNMALGTGGSCPGGIPSGTAVNVALIIQAVDNALNGCPTDPTPGANDCCQCPDFCSVPVAGTCGGCTVVVGASCSGGSCTAPTSTPTATPTKTVRPTNTPENQSCFTNNGDGTISDGCTGLVWEKKDQAGGLHQYNTGYTWAGVCTDNGALCQPNAGAAAACAGQTGGAVGCSQCASGTCVVDPSQTGAATTIWDWLNQLNSSVFAGYNDWRIPSVGHDGGRPELETILAAPYPCTGIPYPCVSAPFNTDCAPGCTVANCSCTGPFWYWSATTYVADPFAAWSVAFVDGRVGTYSLKTSGVPGTGDLAVRAVRGG